ncbi:glycoside hydrolase family 10 protein [Allomuricauda sp. NBRC 101325]|uniref:glycoside hydrolase family 10 protein n=1 Tax=Allomuricauda sp. NBRC 101325 TaxID=1113758 RepID=UPI002553607E|nr:family 10 glycosylhydrolase [Muricauda sp. NBRC 101325]
MRRILYILPVLFFMSCATIKAPKKEFRGVWIATVANIDWPKNPNDDVAKKKQDFIEILDFYQKMNFNAAIVQVRTAGDALYPTDLAPWSRYLTAEEGSAPEEFQEPLKWMIEETHARGMEFHAWLNPYRATVSLDTTLLSKNHDYYLHPDWIVTYGNKNYYNPGLPEVRAKFNKIIEELVTNYEVDAIHFDDYFYPYKVEGETFDDAETFSTYGLEGQSLQDWRRSNVDSLVQNVHQTIKKHKPWVQFGISPFGVWKNNSTDPMGSETKAGQTTYEDLYADPLLWVQKGWLDYLAPQVYWSMEYPVASHKIITSWWNQHTPNTNLYIGNGTYKIRNNADKAWNKKNEIPKQLNMARELDHVDGNIFFSAKSLIGQHEKVNAKLIKRYYRFPSENPGPLNKVQRDVQLPAIRSVQQNQQIIEICISHTDTIPRFINLYNYQKGNYQLIGKEYLSESETEGCYQFQLTKKQLRNNFQINISDAFGNESAMKQLNIN